jgi:hypothetical protein
MQFVVTKWMYAVNSMGQLHVSCTVMGGRVKVCMLIAPSLLGVVTYRLCGLM